MLETLQINYRSANNWFNRKTANLLVHGSKSVGARWFEPPRWKSENSRKWPPKRETTF